MILCKEILQPGVPSEAMLNAQASVRLALAALVPFGTVVLLAVVRRNHPAGRRLIVCAAVAAVFIVFHPFWTVSTDGGDCGLLRVWASWGVLGIEAVLVAAQLFSLLWRADTRVPEHEDYDDRLG